MTRPPPPPNFPQAFPGQRATRSTTQPTAGNPHPPESTFYHPQVPTGGTYLPQHPEPHISLQSSAPPPVRHSTRPPAPAPAPASALTNSYPSSHPYPSGTIPQSPQPPSFPIPDVPGGYGVPSNPSGMVPLPPLPMTTYPHNVQVGYQNGEVPGISHQRSAAVGWSHRDDGPSSYGHQDFEPRRDTMGDMNDYARERGSLSSPFAARGRQPQPTTRAGEQGRQPDLPCRLCQCPTPADEHARLGGFCSERHKWQWSDSNPNQTQPRRTRAEGQGRQPDPPCTLCQRPTPAAVHARLGGFCSEGHKWEWDSNPNQTLPHRMP